MKHSDHYNELSKIFKRLESLPDFGILSEHIKLTINQPPSVPEIVYQLKTVCAIAPLESKRLLGETLFMSLINI